MLQAQPGATFWPAVPRLVAIGDLHGDMDKAQQAFRLGGLIDEQGRWSGGSTTAVQVHLHTQAAVKVPVFAHLWSSAATTQLGAELAGGWTA